MPEGLTSPADTLLEQDTLTGDWGGLRDRLRDRGLAITPVYEGEVFGNTGGADQGVIADGFVNIALDLDLERITGFWKDATLHANALYIYGDSLSERYVGDFSNTSNLAGYNSVRLQELWLEQSFWTKRASLKLGLIAVDTEFFTSNTASLFINGTFGAFTLIGANFTNAPVYPLASPGIRFHIAPTSNFYFQGGVFNVDSGSDPAGNDDAGTHFHINAADGAFVILEAGYLLNQSPNDRGLAGTYKVGAFFQDGQYTTWSSQAAAALGTGRLSSNGTNYAVYGVIDQEIYKHGAEDISAFARGGFASSRYSFVDGYVDAGFNFTGFIPGRPDDVAGVAAACSLISSDFSDAQALQGAPRSTSETAIEATYKIQVAPWLSIQPDVQYIINPSGVTGSRDAFVAGFRTTVAF